MRTPSIATLVFAFASALAHGEPPASASPPAPYSLPWQLRPAAVANVIRSDTSLALFDVSGSAGSTVATMLLVARKVTPRLAPLLRVGLVANAPPDTVPEGSALLNPVLGGTYLLSLRPDLKLALFLAATIPIGQGGGNDPDPGSAAAIQAGIPTRSAMDNAMFAVNDFTVFPGVDLAWVQGGLTVQAEATVLQLTRVRGEDVQKDASRTNFAAGLHAGYFVHRTVSIGAELRYQRWLSTPAAVEADEDLRDNITVAVGPRAHFKIGGVWLRPGISYAMGLDEPMTRQSYKIVQVDLPVVLP